MLLWREAGQQENSEDVWRVRWGEAWEKTMEEEELSRKHRELLKTAAASANPAGRGSGWDTECDSGSSKQTALSLCHSCL